MRWNKVDARIKYKSGTYVSQVLAPDCFKPGDEVRVLVLRGYEADATIQRILKEDVKRTDNYAVVVTTPKYEEEIKMIVDDLFVTVFVSSPRGAKWACKALAPFETGMEVAFEGSDGSLHVGTVDNCISVGVSYNLCGYMEAGFIAQVVTRTKIEEAKEIRRQYADAKRQLAARKKLFEERAIWQALAEHDPEAKRLLDQLDTIRTGAQDGN